MMNLHIFSSAAQLILSFDLIWEGCCNILILVGIEDPTKKNVTIYSAGQFFTGEFHLFLDWFPGEPQRGSGLSLGHSVLWNVL